MAYHRRGSIARLLRKRDVVHTMDLFWKTEFERVTGVVLTWVINDEVSSVVEVELSLPTLDGGLYLQFEQIFQAASSAEMVR